VSTAEKREEDLLLVTIDIFFNPVCCRKESNIDVA